MSLSIDKCKNELNNDLNISKNNLLNFVEFGLEKIKKNINNNNKLRKVEINALMEILQEYLFSKLVQGLTALSGFLYSQKLIKDVKSFYLGNLKKIAIPALLVLGFMAIWNVVYMFVNKDYNYLSL